MKIKNTFFRAFMSGIASLVKGLFYIIEPLVMSLAKVKVRSQLRQTITNSGPPVKALFGGLDKQHKSSVEYKAQKAKVEK